MDVLSIDQMMAREKTAFAAGTTILSLMEAAGEALAHQIRLAYPEAAEFLVFIGKGNNGGDGLVVARHLISTGRPVRVVLTTAEKELGELPRSRLDALRGTFSNLEILPWSEDLHYPGSHGIAIDALLGVQARGPLRDDLARVVTSLNTARNRHFFRTVALDLPSGLAAFEKGDAPPEKNAAVMADLTLAVGFAKDVLCRESLAGWVGRLEVAPWNDETPSPGAPQVLLAHELARLLPRRNALSYKGDFGKLAIVAGSVGFTGAPILCAQAAQAMGAGLLSVLTLPDALTLVASQAPHEAMVSSWDDRGQTPRVVEGASAIAFGPGLGEEPWVKEMLHAVLAVGCPVVIDADGLSVLAKNPDLLREARGPVVLTPHVGEMGRLLGRKFRPNEREAVAREFTDRHRVTLVLKGTRTLITAEGEPFFFNTTGNPGLSTGGSGDTLTGILAALLGQGLSPLEACRLGVWLHGHAADLALAARGCEEGLTPTLLSAHLGAALVSLRAQASPPAGLLERAAKL